MTLEKRARQAGTCLLGGWKWVELLSAALLNHWFGEVRAEAKEVSSMDNPGQLDLPFFAYGIFQPGQLGYHRLRDLVREARRDGRIKGCLRIRDGLPLIDPDGSGEVSGTVLVFKPEGAAEAYKRIGEIEPDKHYRWDQRDAQGTLVNVLVGKSPKKGSIESEQGEWNGRSDPLFTSALNVIEETLNSRAYARLSPLGFKGYGDGVVKTGDVFGPLFPQILAESRLNRA